MVDEVGLSAGRLRSIDAGEFPAFFAHLSDLLAENNATGGPRFQPQSDDDHTVPEATQSWFRSGATIEVGRAGWRRTWLVHGNNRQIIAHVDLRHRDHPMLGSRCWLGMGVRRQYRRLGLGAQLLAHAEGWAKEQGLAAIDLEVLNDNLPAIRLYLRSGYAVVAETMTAVAVDGEQVPQTLMSKALAD